MQPRTKFYVLCCAAALAVAPACTISHNNDKESDNQKVEIKTPFAELKVGTDVSAQDTGMALYPGARERKDSGDDHKANVQIGGDEFALKVVALKYLTDDSPDKVIDFYRKDLKKYGNVLECPKGIKESHSDSDDGEIRCSDSGSSEPGKLTLAVGIPKRQHLVSVKPNGKGSEFDLVYVNIRGKETM